MRLAGTVVTQVNYLDPERGQHVGDETPVTTPPQDFGAHDRGVESAGEHEELVEAVGKLLGGNVVGICAKGGVSPRLIDRARARASPAAEFGDPAVEDRISREVVGERLSGKVGQTPRTRKTSNISHELDVVQREQVSKVVAGARRVPDRPNAQGHAATDYKC